MFTSFSQASIEKNIFTYFLLQCFVYKYIVILIPVKLIIKILYVHDTLNTVRIFLTNTIKKWIII